MTSGGVGPLRRPSARFICSRQLCHSEQAAVGGERGFPRSTSSNGTCPAGEVSGKRGHDLLGEASGVHLQSWSEENSDMTRASQHDETAFAGNHDLSDGAIYPA
jgi:hypothetical protein